MCCELKVLSYPCIIIYCLSVSALIKLMPFFEHSNSTPDSLLQIYYPRVFIRFLLRFAKALTLGNRAEFKLWCKGQIPGSKLDINPVDDGDFIALIESLLESNIVTLTDLSLLEEFLITVDCRDLLESLKEVELQISLSSIIEVYIKSVKDLRRGAPMKLSCDQANIVKFLLAVKERNEDVICLAINQLEKFEEDRIILKIIENSSPEISQLSWSKFTSYLVFIGEFYASFSRRHTQLPDVKADGYYMSLFLDTKTCERLSGWMLKNGGLVSD